MTISLQACGRKVRIHSTSPLSRISDVTTVLPEKKELTPEVTNDDETTQQTIPKDLIRQKPTHGKRCKSPMHNTYFNIISHALCSLCTYVPMC